MGLNWQEVNNFSPVQHIIQKRQLYLDKKQKLTLQGSFLPTNIRLKPTFSHVEQQITSINIIFCCTHYQ